MILATAAVLLASLAIVTAEPPPPPYDPEGTVPVYFEPFNGIEARVFVPGYVHSELWANSPEEGIRLCLFFQEQDGYTNDPNYWCRVEPMSEMPDVTQDGWINEFAPEWA